jgi:C-terminal peptidase prc
MLGRLTIFSSMAILSTVLGLASTAFAEKPSAEQYWARTEMSFQLLQNRVLQCDGSLLLACVQSLNIGAAAMQPKAIFATDKEASQSSPLVGKKIRSFGALGLYLLQIDTSEGMNRLQLEKIQAARKLQIEAIAELVQSRRRVKIKAILKATKKEMLQGRPKSEAFLAGQMTNAYMNAAFDPHTHVIPSAQDSDLMHDADESFFGIGSILEQKRVEQTESPLVFHQLIESGGAETAGIRRNDILLAINGKSVAGKNIEQVTVILRGPENTSVNLLVQRNDQQLLFKVFRKKISLPNVSAKIVQHLGKKFGYIKLESFMDANACDKIQAQIRNMSWSGAEALIFDLRGNGGGLLSEATCIGALFVGTEPIVEERTVDGEPINFYVGKKKTFTKLPMVTLIDSGSASASEILAGALQDHQRSLILGDRSFGKATVQQQSEWDANLLLYKTVSRFYLPSGRTNQVVGILPDIPLEPFPGATEDDKFALREADAYTNALPALGPAWMQPRPQYVQQIKSCMQQSHRAETLYRQNEAGHSPLDYQLLAAEEALACATK